jgi:hypothetical protein
MDIDDIITSSFMNFHAKGLHYLCLERTELVTVKAYFFDETFKTSNDVVIPHNHRYDFVTKVLAGKLKDILYQEVNAGYSGAKLFNRFDFHTPLNGGDGFKWVKPVCLAESAWGSVRPLTSGGSLYRKAADIHTIRVDPGTVLLLTQMQDINGIDVPSQAYQSADAEMFPNTDGLYDQMTEDQIIGFLDALSDMGVSLNHLRL